MSFLEIHDLRAGYGVNEVLRGIDLQVGQGEIHLLTGHNGAGKTTLLRAIHGLLALRGGSVALDGVDLGSAKTADRVELGFAYIPQERAVFPSMTVRENLRCGLTYAARGVSVEEGVARVQEILPEITELLDRRASLLSGGQQRICALGRALATAPKVLMLDEPSVGLSPILARRVIDATATARDELGVTVLLAEQNLADASSVADQVHVLRDGRIAVNETGQEFLARPDWVTLF